MVKVLDLDPQGRWFDPWCGHDKICTAVGPLSKALNLNPIEPLWEQIDRMVREKCPSSQSNLCEVLQEAWGEMYLSLSYMSPIRGECLG